VLPEGSFVTERADDDSEDLDSWYGPATPPWPDPEDSTLGQWLDSRPPITRWRRPAPQSASRLALELKDRDLEVLRLLASGESTADIARELAYSESMIKHVIHGVVTGIGARNRAHAVAIAIRAGII